MKHLSLFSIFMLCLAATPLWAQQSKPIPAKQDTKFVALVKSTLSSTVKIFGAGGIRGIASEATGVIVDKRGLILTYWSVSLKTANLRVVDHQGREYFASIHRGLPRLGFAILKLKFDKKAKAPIFKPMKFSSLEFAPIGTAILSFGNAFGVAVGDEKPGVFEGYITGRMELDARIGVVRRRIDGTMYLLDAPCNPGTQGGPCVDLNGKLLGINGQAIESRSTNTPINFAIPVRNFKKYVSEASKNYEQDQAVQAISPIPEDQVKHKLGFEVLRFYFNRPPPVYVETVIPGSPASTAGLKPDDLIFQVNKVTIRTVDDFDKVMSQLKPGVRVSVTVKRKNDMIRLKLDIPKGSKDTENSVKQTAKESGDAKSKDSIKDSETKESADTEPKKLDDKKKDDSAKEDF